MVGPKLALLLVGLATVSALPQPEERFEWPDRPGWWPGSLPWPPAWPDQPSWWPDSLPWPPAIPEQWPDQPAWWPDFLPWPPSLPEQWPDQPDWWPDSLPWPPAFPEDITWPPEIDIGNIPYVPSRDNQFHLFTRQNPQISQLLVFENEFFLTYSHYSSYRRTVILLHDRWGSATDEFIALLVPSFLSAADVNVIVVQWKNAAHENRLLSALNTVLSANFVSRFARWLTKTTYGDVADFHIVGLGVGAHKAGLVSRLLDSRVGYVTALDPSKGTVLIDLFLLPPLSPNVSQYTEVIHTDVGNSGFIASYGDVDFYPNGGFVMPGCGGDSVCNRNRAAYYFAESLQTGGFTGIECGSYLDAVNNNCDHPGRLNLGGIKPKTGSKGVYWLTTNAAPPFSQG